MGYATLANGRFSHAQGNGTKSSGISSHTEGTSTAASGDSAHAEGTNGSANGNASHVEGYNSTTTGEYSHAEGWTNSTTGDVSHAEGWETESIGYGSHVEGQLNTTEGKGSHSEGYHNRSVGDYSHSEGSGTRSNGKHSHSEGISTQAVGISSHAEGGSTMASGDYSHTEGKAGGANGEGSHSEGLSNIADGDFTHSEGYDNISVGDYSHSEGTGTSALGISSHSEGYHTIATRDNSLSIGMYNTGEIDNILEVGVGSSESDRKNALEISETGELLSPQQTLTNITNDKQLVTKEYVDNNAGGTPEWGNIIGTLSAQTDLQDELNYKIDIVTSATYNNIPVFDNNGGIYDDNIYIGDNVSAAPNVIWSSEKINQLVVSAGTGGVVEVLGTSGIAVDSITDPTKPIVSISATDITDMSLYSINDLYDVSATGIGNGQILEWDDIAGTFKPGIKDGGGGGGDVSGPDTSTDNGIVLFDGTTGKVIKDGGMLLNELTTSADFNTHTSDTSIHFAQSDIDYGNIQNTPDLSGFVKGPNSSNDNTIVLFDSTTGKLIKDSGETKDSAVWNANRLEGRNIETGTIPNDGDLLIYDSTNNQWKYSPPTPPASGTTSNRPSNPDIGFPYFSTDLGYPIFWNGTNWVNASGGYVIGSN